MEQDMNSYLEQLRARTEKRLQSEQVEATEVVNATVKEAQNASDRIDSLLASLNSESADVKKETDTLRYELPKVSYNKESEEMMDNLMAWADKEPTLPFEPVSETPTSEKEHEIPQKTAQETSVFRSVEEYISNDEEDQDADTNDEPVESPKSKSLETTEIKPEKKDSKRFEREQKRKAKEYRRALVEKENGSSRGIIGEIFYVLLFVILVVLTILAVLYLLQTIAGIKILDVEAIFDLVFGWISNKILK